ncbi:MAG: FHA domain-containing protein [Chloroflexota bacterium]|jgi:pSer/pThr/pTyr-binding forkhead associated (FHA) protein
MNKCYECGEPQLEGAVFCTECGASLIQKATDTAANLTTVLPFRRFTTPLKSPPVVQADVPLKTDEKQVVFIIPGHRRRLEMTLKEQLYIGRADPEAELNPELDLTNAGAEDAGVSRIHAVIQLTEEGVVLRDLNSTNGTLLNNYSLEPETSYLLNNGDEIHFGTLLVHILFNSL